MSIIDSAVNFFFNQVKDYVVQEGIKIGIELFDSLAKEISSSNAIFNFSVYKYRKSIYNSFLSGHSPEEAKYLTDRLLTELAQLKIQIKREAKKEGLTKDEINRRVEKGLRTKFKRYKIEIINRGFVI